MLLFKPPFIKMAVKKQIKKYLSSYNANIYLFKILLWHDASNLTE